MNQAGKRFCAAIGFFAAFAWWTAVVCLWDVQAVGPQGSTVGLASINQGVHQMTGVHVALYVVTDWLSLVPVCVCMGFGILGLSQWIRRGSVLKVDRSILVLGGFYVITIAAYLFFERFVINCRPVLIDEILEASYPSSTTVLVLSVMPTAIMQMNARMKKGVFRSGISLAAIVFIVLMVAGRFVSGVHWFSDIVGGMLLSAGLVMMYDALVCALGM